MISQPKFPGFFLEENQSLRTYSIKVRFQQQLNYHTNYIVGPTDYIPPNDPRIPKEPLNCYLCVKSRTNPSEILP